jgi:dihydrofolate reductase
MCKLIAFNLITVDGYFAGPGGEIDWHNVDVEFNQYAIAMLEKAGTLIFGRLTYQLMADYWPTEQGMQDDPVVAAAMNRLQKVVFSRTLGHVEWENARPAARELTAEIEYLKQQPGKDLVILGSGSIVSTLTPTGLIDDFRLIVNPLILGGGKPMFTSLADRFRIQLIGVRPFKNGNVLLQYKPAGKN